MSFAKQILIDMTLSPVYDTIGATYGRTRRPDPRIARQIHRHLDGAASVINIGAGTGSYEPPGTVLAIEPSAVMLAQRPIGSAPAVRAFAEALLDRDALDVGYRLVIADIG